MFFIFLVYIAALTLEGLGSYISVIGLAAKTGPILIFLAITLDFSKIMIASVLYKRWKDLHLLLRFILVPVIVFLVTVTSTGTYAYLIQEFGKTTAVAEQQKMKIDTLQKEKEKLQGRKEEIDKQIAQLPPDSVNQRKRLTDLFAKESNYINERLITLDKELPEAQLEVMKESGHSGTLGSIASAYNVSPEQVSKIVAFFIVLVIDPLAIVLLTVANFLVEQRKKELLLPQKTGASGNPWDRFKANLFNNKGKFSLFTRESIHPYTDSEGKLFKASVSLNVNKFILDVKSFKPEVKPINFMKDSLSINNTLQTYVQPEPILIKNTIHLTPKRMIKKSFSFEPVVEKLLNKLDDHLLIKQDILKDISTVEQHTKDFIILPSSALIENVTSVSDEKKAQLISDKKQYLDVQGLLSSVTITTTESLAEEPIKIDVAESLQSYVEPLLTRDLSIEIKTEPVIDDVIINQPVEDDSSVKNIPDNIILEGVSLTDIDPSIIDSDINNEPSILKDENKDNPADDVLKYHEKLKFKADDRAFDMFESRNFVPSGYNEDYAAESGYEDDEDPYSWYESEEETSEEYKFDSDYIPVKGFLLAEVAYA